MDIEIFCRSERSFFNASFSKVKVEVMSKEKKKSNRFESIQAQRIFRLGMQPIDF